MVAELCMWGADGVATTIQTRTTRYVWDIFLRPFGACSCVGVVSQGLRPGLHSRAASRLSVSYLMKYIATREEHRKSFKPVSFKIDKRNGSAG